MNDKIYTRHLQCVLAISFLMLPSFSHAVTTLVSPSRYTVNEGVAFTLGNSGADHFLFNWTDPSGDPALSFSDQIDPTLVLTRGQTYTFQRITGSHPFIIMNNTAAGFIDGSDGSFFRTTTDSALITAATLQPSGDFTASGGTPGNTITWTPDQLGDFWYTCSVTSHTGMTGLITVIPEPSSFAVLAGLGAFGLVATRRLRIKRIG